MTGYWGRHQRKAQLERQRKTLDGLRMCCSVHPVIDCDLQGNVSVTCPVCGATTGYYFYCHVAIGAWNKMELE